MEATHQQEHRNSMKHKAQTKRGYHEKGYAIVPGSLKVEDATRMVEGYFSAFNIIDSDRDKILKGAFDRSIREHGPGSPSNRKIAHLAFHDLRRPAGKLVELKEDDTGLYFRSRMGEHTDGNDGLLMYKDGIITEHSIGFNYIGDKMRYVDNPQAPDKSYFEIEEVQLWEGSYVTFGANSETPNLSAIKSQSDLNNVLDALDQRAEVFIKALRDGNYSQKFNNLAELELLQIQNGYKALINWEPQAKPKSAKTKKPKTDTEAVKLALSTIKL